MNFKYYPQSYSQAYVYNFVDIFCPNYDIIYLYSEMTLKL